MDLISKLFKLIFYFFKYTLPVIFIFIAISLAQTVNNKFENKRIEWFEYKCNEITHVVTIYWDNMDSSKITTIEVKEDDDYSINGKLHSSYYSLFDVGEYTYKDSERILLPSIAYKEGYTLIGFYNNPYGGVMYISPSGYGLKTIEEDMNLYALYKEIEKE